jgi:hypothetical protein
MTHSLEAFPLDITAGEQAVGFRRMVLSLGDYIGPWPGENVEVAARRLSDFDVLIKRRMTTRTGQIKVFYTHLRFGYPSWREQIRFLWRDIRFGFWRSWFRGCWPWKVDWQHIPFGNYDSPTDGCSRTLNWRGVVGLVFHEYTV